MTFIVYPEIPRVQYTASPLQTDFEYPFPIFTTSDLSVYKTLSASVASNNDLLTLNVDYTVSDAGQQDGGIVTLITACVGGETITIERNVSIERTSMYSNGQPINANALNNDFNKLYAICQDLLAYIVRVLPSYPVPAVLSAARRTLPLLAQGYYWQGGPNNSIIAVQSEENPDASTLRSELAVNATANSAGANLVGYYDTGSSTAMTVREKLDNLSGQITNNILSIIDFGGDPTGLTDTTAAFDAALSYFASHPEFRNLWFPAGTYLFETQPSDIALPIRIFGDGLANTILNVAFDAVGGAGFFNFTGVDDGQVQLMKINKTDTHTGGCAVSFVTDGVSVPSSYPAVLDILITSDSGSTWNYGVIASNEFLTLPIQNVIINNVTIEGCTTACLYVVSAQNSSINGVLTQLGFGSISSIYLIGNSSYYFVAGDISIRQATDLYMDYISSTTITCGNLVNLRNTINCANMSIYGYVQNREYNWDVSNNAYMTVNDFADDATSDTDSGYHYMGNGMIMQWIKVTTSSNSDFNLSLPISFQEINMGVMSSVVISGNVSTMRATDASNTLSSVNITIIGSGSKTVRIYAIGR